MLYTPDQFQSAAVDPAAIPATPNWRDTLSWGDVVSFYFPVKEVDGPASKRCPCLVINAFVKAEQRFVTLAYGTSTERRGLRRYEVQVYDAEAISSAGLTRPTRFLGSRRITVSTQHPGFICGKKTDAPVLGRLKGPAFMRMNNIRDRLQKDADAAAHDCTDRTRRQFYLQRRT